MIPDETANMPASTHNVSRRDQRDGAYATNFRFMPRLMISMALVGY